MLGTLIRALEIRDEALYFPVQRTVEKQTRKSRLKIYEQYEKTGLTGKCGDVCENIIRIYISPCP